MRLRLYGHNPAQMREMFLAWYLYPLTSAVFKRLPSVKTLVCAVGRYQSHDLDDAVGHCLFLSSSMSPVWPEVMDPEKNPWQNGSVALLFEELRLQRFGDSGPYLDDRGTFAHAFGPLCLPSEGPLPQSVDASVLRPVYIVGRATDPQFQGVSLVSPEPSVLDATLEARKYSRATELALQSQPLEETSKNALPKELQGLSPEDLLAARGVREEREGLFWSMRALLQGCERVLRKEKNADVSLEYERNRVRSDLDRLLRAYE